ncbi:hypothetical protein PHYSODRAFT_253494 [Phytophthora sojae]|uniref:PiggyBac transposable element-derived protein domain-containing protein n=1 Tax=Phytophthora sojae (strain P6497) TaxID=1094619 RepID=G4YTX8_PHYSP|nr:hypothetical protein PHYSODRAFT_253494 [Phytophthora sojae]EGZ25449.1 hypothetical protein PHYSODRAFT_253494 [Phytophthora sojae]|eukprot:XP_009520737.1 hypothetical protein PHYSODRAFT_253494 [Phytophthora sojae]
MTGEQHEVACPRIVKDYQTYMGGVDLCIKDKNYYKSLFLGLVGLDIINAFIVFNARRAASNLPKLSHVKFLKQLHLELCQLHEEDWEALQSNERFQATPSKPRQLSKAQAAHQPVQNDEWRPGNNQQGRKRRARVCKVCSLLKGNSNARGGDSSVYCSQCKLPNASKKPMVWRVFLCEKVRHTYNGSAMSCFDFWHKAWRNGTLLPKKAAKRKIRARAPARSGNENEEKDNGGSVQSSSVESTTGGPHLPKRARVAPDAVMRD